MRARRIIRFVEANALAVEDIAEDKLVLRSLQRNDD